MEILSNLTNFICIVEFKTTAGVFKKGYKIKARNERDAIADAHVLVGFATILSCLAVAEGLIEN